MSNGESFNFEARGSDSTGGVGSVYNNFFEEGYSFNENNDVIISNTKNELSNLNNEIRDKIIMKYSSEYKELFNDVFTFIYRSFNNDLSGSLSEYNIDNFDNQDNTDGFSDYELENYMIRIDEAIKQMNILGSFESFKSSYNSINDKPDFFSWKGDIALSNSIDLQEYLLGESDKYLVDGLKSFSEEELYQMGEKKFDITDSETMKDFIILLGLELGEGIEDIIKFIGNVPAGLVVLPRYLSNRATLINGEVDTKKEVEAQMENKMLINENPSLVIMELVGEKGIEMLKGLGEMMTSGKNGDIVTYIAVIAGLFLGGAGVKGIPKLNRKMDGMYLSLPKIPLDFYDLTDGTFLNSVKRTGIRKRVKVEDVSQKEWKKLFGTKNKDYIKEGIDRVDDGFYILTRGRDGVLKAEGTDYMFNISPSLISKKIKDYKEQKAFEEKNGLHNF